MTPKVFISYSWSSHEHQMLIKNWAEQLIADGVAVILDIYDLKEGHDKYAFMERMVTDESVTHVLVFSDRLYAEKANGRRSGVGTESQIISKNVYEKVDQYKFIPIVCELDETGRAYLPTFLESRIWIDFSSPVAANKNWEQLVRLLYGKPQHEKPTLGKRPAYLSEDTAPASPAISKYRVLRQAILDRKPGITLYRQEFLSACVQYADDLRIRAAPDINNLGSRILQDCGKLKTVRDHLLDWVLLESAAGEPTEFTEDLLALLEHLLELKSRPEAITSWNDSWFGAHALFVYQTFLYIIASLLKTGKYKILHEIYTSHYLSPKSARNSDLPFQTFGGFYGHS